MSERRENSVLLSLQELRRLEDDRVKREQEERQARAEAERRAKEDAERRLRAEEEDRRRAEEERIRRAEEEKLAKVREEQLRLEEAERRARVDGELKLQEQRLRLEIESRGGRSPLKAVVGVALVVAAVAGVVSYWMYSQHKAEQATLQRQLEDERERNRVAQAEYEKKMQTIKREMDERMRVAKSDAEKAQILADARAKQEAATVVREQHKRSKPGRAGGTAGGGEPGKPSGPRIPGKREIGDGILDGIDGKL